MRSVRRHPCIAKVLSVCLSFLFLLTALSPAKAEETKKRIALTFDDGPHPHMTDEILSVLDSYKVKATFFVIGENALLYPEPLQRAVRAGHEIGNHTYSHPKLREQNAESFSAELMKATTVIETVTGEAPTLFRPPEGFYEGVIAAVAEERGYRTVLWSVDTLDWTDASAATVEQRILAGVQDGSIILCHDYIVGKGHTAEALNRVIPKLLAEGFEFVTVSELLDG